MNQLYPHSEIQTLIESHKVIIFGKGDKTQPMCGFTARVQEVFETLPYDYHMVNVLEEPALRQELKTFSDWPTFPQVYIHQEFVGGCDIILEMHAEKQLQELLKA